MYVYVYDMFVYIYIYLYTIILGKHVIIGSYAKVLLWIASWIASSCRGLVSWTERVSTWWKHLGKRWKNYCFPENDLHSCCAAWFSTSVTYSSICTYLEPESQSLKSPPRHGNPDLAISGALQMSWWHGGCDLRLGVFSHRIPKDGKHHEKNLK